MIDLLLHKNNSFIPPSETTSDEQEQIVQAFLTLILTKLGSITIDPTIGSIFELGSTNITDIRFMMSEIIYDTLKIMKPVYNIINAVISEIEENDDSVSIKIIIITTLNETTISINV